MFAPIMTRPASVAQRKKRQPGAEHVQIEPVWCEAHIIETVSSSTSGTRLAHSDPSPECRVDTIAVLGTDAPTESNPPEQVAA